jgi:hypothetical protein
MSRCFDADEASSDPRHIPSSTSPALQLAQTRRSPPPTHPPHHPVPTSVSVPSQNDPSCMSHPVHGRHLGCVRHPWGMNVDRVLWPSGQRVHDGGVCVAVQSTHREHVTVILILVTLGWRSRVGVVATGERGWDQSTGLHDLSDRPCELGSLADAGNESARRWHG